MKLNFFKKTLVLFCSLSLCVNHKASSAPSKNSAGKMNLRALSYEGERRSKIMLDQGSCYGSNLSPEISWSLNESARSYAVIIRDADCNFTYWTIYNIPSEIKLIPEGYSSAGAGKPDSPGIQALNDYGKAGYGGYCPSITRTPGKMVVELFALKVQKIAVPANSTAALTRLFIEKYAISKSVTTIS